MFAQLLAQLYAHQITPSVQEELIQQDVQCLTLACHQPLATKELYVLPCVQSLVQKITCGVMVELMLMDA